MIYKYFDCNAAYLTVKNDFLKFSDPNDFNDCYEMVINVKEYSIKDFFKLYNRKYKIRDLYLRYANIGLKLSFDEFIDKLKDDSFKQKIVNHDKKAINSWLDEFPMIVSKVFSMSCFSKSFESILMWAHYADKYKGCVIGFDYDEYKEYAPMLFDVRYKAKPIVINPKYCFGQKNIDLMKKF